MPPLPMFGSSSGASNADIRLSPLRRYFVPPKVAQVPIPPKWPDDTAPRLPLRIPGEVARESAMMSPTIPI
jgi:hypothetical protein